MREVHDCERRDQLLLRDVGARSAALGLPIDPERLRRMLATVHLDQAELDLMELRALQPAEFIATIAAIVDGWDDVEQRTVTPAVLRPRPRVRPYVRQREPVEFFTAEDDERELPSSGLRPG
jgi:hypothetical protein